MTEIETRLESMNLELPPTNIPAGNYLPYVRMGDQLFISGQLSRTMDGAPLTGKLGLDTSVEQGYQAARSSAIFALSAVKLALGNLDDVIQIVKVLGLVNSTPEFTEHSQVINGASDLFAEIFGDSGKHARAAIGVPSLPFGAAVEIEMLVLVK